MLRRLPIVRMQRLANRGSVIRELRGRDVFFDIPGAEMPSLSVDSPQSNLHHRSRSHATYQGVQYCWSERPIQTHQRHTGETGGRDQADTANPIGMTRREM